jgi:hypothetical protein
MAQTPRSSVNTTDPSNVDNGASRVLISFRSPETGAAESEDWWIADSEWLAAQMTEDTYRRYLRWAHAGPVSVGQEWDEFVNCGCASPEDVVLRVERVDGGSAIGARTTIDIVSRKSVLEVTDEHS